MTTVQARPVSRCIHAARLHAGILVTVSMLQACGGGHSDVSVAQQPSSPDVESPAPAPTPAAPTPAAPTPAAPTPAAPAPTPAAPASARIDSGASEAITGQEVRLAPVAEAGTAGARITQLRWDFGDGSPALSLSGADSLSAPQFKAYAQPGTYTVTLGVTDSAGGSGTASYRVTVRSYAPTGKLNDTGNDWCNAYLGASIGWTSYLVCAEVDWTGREWGTMMDAFFGRDAQALAGSLSKTGSGAAGFDFTRLGADGAPLAIQDGVYSATGNGQDGTRWDCVRDNVTGLIWEVKRMDDPQHLRYYAHRYTWYDSTAPGPHGYTSSNQAACTVLDQGCNTQALRDAVNALPAGQALCGFRDWRVPTRDELLTIVHLGKADPAIDTAHFPDVDMSVDVFGYTWTSTINPDATALYAKAWHVRFQDGLDDLAFGAEGKSVRLVRSGR